MPTENRSSNTEMVSFHRELSDELAELIAHRARVCGGGAFDIWEAICEGFGKPAEQHQGVAAAWLIMSGGKDIENRTWHTKFRGRFLVHASAGMTRREFLSAFDFMAHRGIKPPFPVPPDNLLRGGIIGSVELVDSVDRSESPWYMGEKGFVLRDPRPLPFMPLKGRLGFFEVSDDALCTCPSGDGSLRWPCLVHPREEVQP